MDTTVNAATDQPTVIRTGRGLTIAGTRITLYQVMDYLNDDWPPHLIQHWLDITEKQMADVIASIDSHREEVEAEDELVLRWKTDCPRLEWRHGRCTKNSAGAQAEERS